MTSNDKHDTLKQGELRDNLHESELRISSTKCNCNITGDHCEKHPLQLANTKCIFCERPTKDQMGVCKRLWCRIKIKWEEIQYGRNKS